MACNVDVIWQLTSYVLQACSMKIKTNVVVSINVVSVAKVKIKLKKTSLFLLFNIYSPGGGHAGYKSISPAEGSKKKNVLHFLSG